MINVYKVVRYSQIEKCMPCFNSTYVENKYRIFSFYTDFSYSVCTEFWESHLETLVSSWSCVMAATLTLYQNLAKIENFYQKSEKLRGTSRKYFCIPFREREWFLNLGSVSLLLKFFLQNFKSVYLHIFSRKFFDASLKFSDIFSFLRSQQIRVTSFQNAVYI